MDGPSTASNNLLEPVIPPADWETGRDAGAQSAKTQHTEPLKLCSCAIGSLLLIFTCIPSAIAEDTCRGIRGTVTDSEGKPINHAPIVVSTKTANANFRALTKHDGSYDFSRLPVGTYSLTLQVPGFQTTTIYGIRIDTGSSFFEKIEMVPGKMTNPTLVPADAHSRSSCTHNKSRIAQSTPGSTSPARIPAALAPQ